MKIVLAIAPFFLFLFKNVLPNIGKATNSGKFNFKPVLEELIQLSTDYLFAAITYLLPKAVELLSLIHKTSNEIKNISVKDHNMILSLSNQLDRYISRCITIAVVCAIFLSMLPFSVLLNNLAIKYGDAQKYKTKRIIIAFVFTVSIVSFLGSLSFF